jgi:hypothetical protein
MDDNYTKRRRELQDQLVQAALALLEYTRAESAVIPVRGSDPAIVVAVGEPESIVDDMMLSGSLR